MIGIVCVALLSPLRQLTRIVLTVPAGDKLMHACAFAGLMLWWGNVYRGRGSRWRIAAWCLLFGILIECAQWPRAPEDADPFDVLADMVGLALGWLLLRTALADVLARAERWLHAKR